MEILQLTKLFWTYSGIYLNENASPNEMLINVVKNYLLIILMSINYCGSICFIYYSNNQKNADLLFAFMQIFVNFFLTINFIIYCNRKNCLYHIYEKIEKIVKKRCNALTIGYYELAMRRSYLVAKWPFTLYIVLYVGGLILMTIISFVYDTINGEYNVLKWPNIIHFRYIELFQLTKMNSIQSFCFCF